jgi:hypothetical protein
VSAGPTRLTLQKWFDTVDELLAETDGDHPQ